MLHDQLKLTKMFPEKEYVVREDEVVYGECLELVDKRMPREIYHFKELY